MIGPDHLSGAGNFTGGGSWGTLGFRGGLSHAWQSARRAMIKTGLAQCLL